MMIEQYLYDAVVAENKTLRAEIEELKSRLGIDDNKYMQSPILFDLYKTDGD